MLTSKTNYLVEDWQKLFTMVYLPTNKIDYRGLIFQNTLQSFLEKNYVCIDQDLDVSSAYILICK